MNRSHLCILWKIQVKVKASVIFLQGSLPFPLHFCFLSFLPLTPPSPKTRILAQVEQVSVTLTGNSLLSSISPQSWTLQIVTILGRWKISVVWHYLERTDIILWAEILSFFKNTSYLKTYFPSPQILQSHCKRGLGLWHYGAWPGYVMISLLNWTKGTDQCQRRKRVWEKYQGLLSRPRKKTPQRRP